MSRRRMWWLRAALLAMICSLWAVGTPLFAGPDEPAHTIYAAAAVRGQFPADKQPGTRLQFVDVPARLDVAHHAAACTAFQPEQDASCVTYGHGDDRDAPVPTTAGRYPPVAYLFAGLPTLVSVDAPAIYVMRLLFAVTTAVSVATALSDLDVLGGRLARLGAFIALTPMTLFLSGTVNPNAAEIALALLVWTSLLRLLADADHGRVSNATVARATVASAGLALVRPLSPLWLAVIAAVLVIGFASPDALRTIASSRAARVGACITAVAAVAQTTWVLLTDPVYGSPEQATDWTLSQTIEISVGRLSSHLREMVGVFGWLDT
ncbi:MAG TPA: DUF2142 domain-containing protein, partial [Acidimicrobiales bacterium]